MPQTGGKSATAHWIAAADTVSRWTVPGSSFSSAMPSRFQDLAGRAGLDEFGGRGDDSDDGEFDGSAEPGAALLIAGAPLD